MFVALAAMPEVGDLEWLSSEVRVPHTDEAGGTWERWGGLRGWRVQGGVEGSGRGGCAGALHNWMVCKPLLGWAVMGIWAIASAFFLPGMARSSSACVNALRGCGSPPGLPAAPHPHSHSAPSSLARTRYRSLWR